MPTARIDKENWFRCGKCGHKLGKAVGLWSSKRTMPAIEIKCHSCKSLNYIMVGGQRNEKRRDHT